MTNEMIDDTKTDILPAQVGTKEDNSPDAQALRVAQQPDPLHDYGDTDKAPAVLPPGTDTSVVATDTAAVVEPVRAPVTEAIQPVEE